VPAKVGGARVDERRSGPGKPLLLTQDGGSGLWQGVERHVAWLFARTERGSQGATGASEVWSSAFVSAENAGRRRPHKRARFPRLSGRTGRAGRSYGGVVKRCFTWGWIVERRSGVAIPLEALCTHCSQRGRDHCGASCGLRSRAIEIGCSSRQCRLQKSVRGILPAMPRWAARRIKAEQDRSVRQLFPRQ
jgi:hypothetical protein